MRHALAIVPLWGLLACTAARPLPERTSAVPYAHAAVENLDAFFAPSGNAFAFVSRRDGTAQLYQASLDGLGARPIQLTQLPGGVPIGPADHRFVTPDGRHAVFQCQPNAYCRADLGGGGGLAKAPGVSGALYQFSPFLVRARPDRFTFEARYRVGGLHIFEGGFDGAPPRLVFRDPSLTAWLRDVSPDGRRALALELKSLDEWALLLVDLEAGRARRVFPPPGACAKVSAAAFSADGTRIYAGTDAGADRATLLVFDATTGAELGRFEEPEHPTAEIEGIVESPDGRRLALSMAAGLIDRVRIVDARTLEMARDARVAPPLGQGRALAFAGDGRLALQWTTPDTPPDLYLADLQRGGWSRLDTGFPAPADRLATEASLERVVAPDGVPIELAVLRPRGAPGRLPVVVLLECGPGEAAKLVRGPLTDLFLAEGYAVVLPNVRGSAGYGRAFQALDDGPRRVDALEDVALVSRWLARQGWADPERLAVAGTSYGGYLALAALTGHPELWRAGVDLYGIADWRSFFATTNAGTAAVYRAEVGSPDHDGAFLDAISPLSAIHRLRAPLFVFHGRDDQQVPVEQSEQLVAAARLRGVLVRTLLAPGEGHGIRRAETWALLRKELGAFLRDPGSVRP